MGCLFLSCWLLHHSDAISRHNLVDPLDGVSCIALPHVLGILPSLFISDLKTTVYRDIVKSTKILELLLYEGHVKTQLVS